MTPIILPPRKFSGSLIIYNTIDNIYNPCYYDTVMNNQQTYETEPINDFTIYRDGQIDRGYELKKMARNTINLIGRGAGLIAISAFEATDLFITEMNKEFNS